MPFAITGPPGRHPVGGALNDAIQTHSISLLCAYCLDRRETEGPRQFPPGLRALHTHLIPVEAAA